MSKIQEEQAEDFEGEGATRFFEISSKTEAEVDERLKSAIAILVPKGLVLPGESLTVAVSGPTVGEVIKEIVTHKHLVALPRLASGRRWPAPIQVDAICGVGELVSAKRLAKDEYLLTIRGVARVRIAEELESHRDFCRIRGERMEDIWPEEGPEALAELAGDLQNLLYRLCAVRPGPAANVLAGMATKLTCPSKLADLGCAVALFTPGSRIQALETLEVDQRLVLACESLDKLLKRERKTGKWQLN